jgi:hypothetical protein
MSRADLTRLPSRWAVVSGCWGLTFLPGNLIPPNWS